MVEKDEVINDTKKKSYILEKQATEAEKQVRELRQQNEELQGQVRGINQLFQMQSLQREVSKKDLKIASLKNQIRVGYKAILYSTA